MPLQISRTKKLCSQLMHLQWRHYQIPCFTWPFTYNILKCLFYTHTHTHIYIYRCQIIFYIPRTWENIKGIYITLQACSITKVSQLTNFVYMHFVCQQEVTLVVRATCYQWHTEGGGCSNPLPPKFRSFDKVEPDCKLSRKCLVFIFQHPN